MDRFGFKTLIGACVVFTSLTSIVSFAGTQCEEAFKELTTSIESRDAADLEGFRQDFMTLVVLKTPLITSPHYIKILKEKLREAKIEEAIFTRETSQSSLIPKKSLAQSVWAQIYKDYHTLSKTEKTETPTGATDSYGKAVVKVEEKHTETTIDFENLTDVKTIMAITSHAEKMGLGGFNDFVQLSKMTQLIEDDAQLKKEMTNLIAGTMKDALLKGSKKITQDSHKNEILSNYRASGEVSGDVPEVTILEINSDNVVKVKYKNGNFEKEEDVKLSQLVMEDSKLLFSFSFFKVIAEELTKESIDFDKFVRDFESYPEVSRKSIGEKIWTKLTQIYLIERKINPEDEHDAKALMKSAQHLSISQEEFLKNHAVLRAVAENKQAKDYVLSVITSKLKDSAAIAAHVKRLEELRAKADKVALDQAHNGPQKRGLIGAGVGFLAGAAISHFMPVDVPTTILTLGASYLTPMVAASSIGAIPSYVKRFTTAGKKEKLERTMNDGAQKIKAAYGENSSESNE